MPLGPVVARVGISLLTGLLVVVVVVAGGFVVVVVGAGFVVVVVAGGLVVGVDRVSFAGAPDHSGAGAGANSTVPHAAPTTANATSPTRIPAARRFTPAPIHPPGG
jgi:hypothetical protein